MSILSSVPERISVDQTGMDNVANNRTHTTNKFWNEALTKKEKPQVTTDYKASNLPLLSSLYPETFKQYMPELYKYLRSNLTDEQVKIYQGLQGKELIDRMESDGRLIFRGAGSDLMRQSLSRLVKSDLFKKSLIVGLAADRKYDIYADNPEGLDRVLKDDGSSLDEQRQGNKQKYWTAFASIDKYEEIPKEDAAIPGADEAPSGKLNKLRNINTLNEDKDQTENPRNVSLQRIYGINAVVFSIQSIIDSDDIPKELSSKQQRILDSYVAHEFGHGMLDLHDGDELNEKDEGHEDDVVDMDRLAFDDRMSDYEYYDHEFYKKNKNLIPNANGKVGSNQLFSQNVMIDLGYNKDTENVGTYLGAEFDFPNPDDFNKKKGKKTTSANGGDKEKPYNNIRKRGPGEEYKKESPD